MDALDFINKQREVARKAGPLGAVIWAYMYEQMKVEELDVIKMTYEEILEELDFLKLSDVVKGVAELDKHNLINAEITLKDKK